MSLELKVENFIPFYIPKEDELKNTQGIYSPDNLNELYNNIIVKKEFNELTLEPNESLKKIRTGPYDRQGINQPFNHQQFMARFLSPNTPYDRMLVFHEVGTGKCVHPSTKITMNDEIININEIWNRYDNIKEISSINQITNDSWLSLEHLNLYTKTFDKKDKKIKDGKILRGYKQFINEMIVTYHTSNKILILFTFFSYVYSFYFSR